MLAMRIEPCPCCGVVNVVGPSQGYEDIHVQEGSHGHWLKEW